jgi:hypothetical protein
MSLQSLPPSLECSSQDSLDKPFLLMLAPGKCTCPHECLRLLADPREMPQCYDVQSTPPSGYSLYPRLRELRLDVRVRDCHMPSAVVPAADEGGKMDLLAHNSF